MQITKSDIRSWLWVLALVVVLVVTLFPFYWIINMSPQNSIELYDVPPHFVPPHPTPENFISVLFQERRPCAKNHPATIRSRMTR